MAAPNFKTARHITFAAIIGGVALVHGCNLQPQAVTISGTSPFDSESWHTGKFRHLPAMAENDLLALVTSLAHPNNQNYNPLDAVRTTNFNNFIVALFGAIDAMLTNPQTGDFCGVRAMADAAGYEIFRLRDTGFGAGMVTNSTGARWLIYGRDKTSDGQAYFVINPYAKTNIIVEVPHAGLETNTDTEGVRIFRARRARALIINKEHRCSGAQGHAGDCGGSTDACADKNYHKADVSHNADNTFHLLHMAYSDHPSTPRFIQLHGMNGGDDNLAQIGDGTSQDVNTASIAVTFTENLRKHVPASMQSAIFACQESGTPPNPVLCATKNLQGRYTNLGATDCTTVNNNGGTRFIHVEQVASLRDDNDSDGLFWGDVSDALRKTWPTCDINTNVSCMIPEQAWYDDLACP